MTTESANPDNLLQQLPKEAWPPVEQWDPPFCGNMDLEIRKNGQWFYQGTPFTRLKLVKLFARVLKREGDNYFLVTPVEKVGIKVEAEAYVMVDYNYDPDQQILRLKTQLDDIIEVDKEHALVVSVSEDGEPYPIVHVRSELFGLLNRNIFYDLIELGEHVTEGNITSCYIRSNGERFLLGSYK